MEKKTKTLNFVEVTSYFIFINIDKNICFQIGKDNKFYGVDSAVVETELTFERDKGVFERKTFAEKKKGDILFYDNISTKPDDISYFPFDNNIYLSWDINTNMLESYKSLLDPTDVVWILKKE